MQAIQELDFGKKLEALTVTFKIKPFQNKEHGKISHFTSCLVYFNILSPQLFLQKISLVFHPATTLSQGQKV